MSGASCSEAVNSQSVLCNLCISAIDQSGAPSARVKTANIVVGAVHKEAELGKHARPHPAPLIAPADEHDALSVHDGLAGERRMAVVHDGRLNDHGHVRLLGLARLDGLTKLIKVGQELDAEG